MFRIPKQICKVLTLIILVVLTIGASRCHAWTSDKGNGTFTNPVLYGDYSDPDIIRVGSDFYLATTTFVSIPGIQILYSKDLINWNYIGPAVSNLNFGSAFSLIGGSRYGGGIMAPCLRYHNGTFYIMATILPNSVTVVYRSSSINGPWTMNQLSGGWLWDPGLMFDDNGTPLVYNGTAGNISVAVLDSGLTTILSNTSAFKLNVASEGSHAYKINGVYYVFTTTGPQYPTMLCSQSTSPTGPFTTTTVCNNGVQWSSPHQGGIVQLANGSWWGFSMTDSGPVGRDLWEGPITWSNGWPYFGNPSAPSIPTTNTKPNVGASYLPSHLSTSDNFTSGTLGLQWQWNHNPDNTKWSLPGDLRLNTETAANFANARNTLTQRTEGPDCVGVIKINTSHLAPGDRAGLSLLEINFGYIAVYKDTATTQHFVYAVNNNGSLTSPSENIVATTASVNNTTLWLKVSCNFGLGTAQFSYSTDGANFTQVGGDFSMHFNIATFEGDRFAIFNYNPNGSSGYLDVNSFREGTKVALLANANNAYVSADNAGSSPLIANRTTVGPWETFVKFDNGDGTVSLQSMANSLFVSADNAGSSPLIANRTTAGVWESFQEIYNGNGSVSFKAMANGDYVCADFNQSPSYQLIANRTSIGPWESFIEVQE